MPSHHPAVTLSLLLLLLATIAAAAPAIYNATTAAGYAYHGCYNETTDIPGTVGTRALYGGTNMVLPGGMTVPLCQAFCRADGTVYKFAGVEYARECWCAQALSSLSEKFPDSACDLTCEGDNSTVCGGNLKLSVYALGAASSARVAWGVGAVAMAMALAMSLNLLG